MVYRNFEKLGIQTSLLGFGCMRFPVDASGAIQEEEAEQMLDTAIAEGVNYIDTAYPYHDGASEPFVGRVLDKYPRESYYLATKLPCWLLQKPEDTERIFDEQRRRLHKEYIDFYLIHALDGERFDHVLSLSVIETCERLKAEGKIKYLGFSFHGSYEEFERIITYRDWDFCQIQYNYMDTEEQAGDRGYELAGRLHVPLVIMEPIKGGSLAKLPDTITPFFQKVRPNASPASFALRWVAAHENVKVILSGMSDMQQTRDNLDTLSEFGEYKEEEKKAVENVAASLRSRVMNGCTGCRYCMPCPAGVDIPGNFQIWNRYHIYENKKELETGWKNKLAEKSAPDRCIQCGNCESVCPQGLKIRADLEKMKNEMQSMFEEQQPIVC